MTMFGLPAVINSANRRLAWLVAMAVDAVQIVALPLFGEGAFSPLDTVLDIVAATLLVKLLGWHWAFVPTFFAELVPGLDLLPTWTAAVFYVTRRQVPPEQPYVTGQRISPQQPEIIPPERP